MIVFERILNAMVIRFYFDLDVLGFINDNDMDELELICEYHSSVIHKKNRYNQSYLYIAAANGKDKPLKL